MWRRAQSAEDTLGAPAAHTSAASRPGIPHVTWYGSLYELVRTASYNTSSI